MRPTSPVLNQPSRNASRVSSGRFQYSRKTPGPGRRSRPAHQNRAAARHRRRSRFSMLVARPLIRPASITGGERVSARCCPIRWFRSRRSPARLMPAPGGNGASGRSVVPPQMVLGQWRGRGVALNARARAMCEAGGAKYCVGASDSSTSIVASAAIAPGQMIEPPDPSPANARRIPALECNGKAIRHRSEASIRESATRLSNVSATRHCANGTIFGAPVVPDVHQQVMSSASGASTVRCYASIPTTPDWRSDRQEPMRATRAYRLSPRAAAPESEPRARSAHRRASRQAGERAHPRPVPRSGAHVRNTRPHHDREVGAVGQRDSDARAPAEAGAGQTGRDRIERLSQIAIREIGSVRNHNGHCRAMVANRIRDQSRECGWRVPGPRPSRRRRFRRVHQHGPNAVPDRRQTLLLRSTCP